MCVLAESLSGDCTVAAQGVFLLEVAVPNYLLAEFDEGRGCSLNSEPIDQIKVVSRINGIGRIKTASRNPLRQCGMCPLLNARQPDRDRHRLQRQMSYMVTSKSNDFHAL
jgi:hypothetical protein